MDVFIKFYSDFVFFIIKWRNFCLSFTIACNEIFESFLISYLRDAFPVKIQTSVYTKCTFFGILKDLKLEFYFSTGARWNVFFFYVSFHINRTTITTTTTTTTTNLKCFFIFYFYLWFYLFIKFMRSSSSSNSGSSSREGYFSNTLFSKNP